MHFYYHEEDREATEEVNDSSPESEQNQIVISLLYFNGVIDE
jgi:hypothetical protein